MSESTSEDDEKIEMYIPDFNFCSPEHTLDFILCKPKLLPLKSVTLEKLEKMQKDADEKIKKSRQLDSELEKEDK